MIMLGLSPPWVQRDMGWDPLSTAAQGHPPRGVHSLPD